MMRKILLALPLVLAACVPDAETGAEATAPIPGDYQLIAIEGLQVAGTPSLRIDTEGMVSGQGPCNRFSGKNAATLPALDLGALVTTRMACLQEGGEDVFFKALGAVREAKRTGDELVMTGPDVTIRWKAVTP